MTTYSARKASRVAGITYRMIDYWDRSDVVKPTVTPATGSGSRRRYSYNDLLRLRTARALAEAGFLLAARQHVGAIDEGVCGGNALVGAGHNWRIVTNADLPHVIAGHTYAGVVHVLHLAAIKADVDLGIAALDLGELIGVTA